MNGKPIARVTVVGAGTIGGGWTALFLAQGLDVVATDVEVERQANLRMFVARAWTSLVELGIARGEPPEINFEPDLAKACEAADFVQENVIERIDVKVPLLARIDSFVRPETIIASSSSALTVTEMQRECRHPERVVLGHPFNPPHLMPLVEVAGGERTSEEFVVRAIDFYASLGKTPVRLQKEVPGHIANRLQAAVFREAVHLFQSGVASIEDIDKAITDGPGLRWALMGPFLTYNLAGGEGGMAAFMRQFARMQETLWADLGDPDLDASRQDVIVAAMRRRLVGQSAEDLASRRDRQILALLKMRLSI
jgi:carnitine 3-dehydrogenase